MPFIVLIAVFALLIVYLSFSVKIVRPYQRGVIERLGRFKTSAEPGLRLLVPFIDRMVLVDMREQVVDVPPQEVITSDNVVVSVDAVVYYEPVDPQRLIYNVASFIIAVTKLAQTNLRNLIGDLQLDQALTSRDSINASLRAQHPRRRHRHLGGAREARRDPAHRPPGRCHERDARADEGGAHAPRDRHSGQR